MTNAERVRKWRSANKKTCACGGAMYYESRACKRCSGRDKFTSRLSMTLDDFRKRDSVKHPAWKDAQIREMARRLHRHLLKLPCANCGYAKHVELAHTPPLSSYAGTTTVAEANRRVVQLCRNCHWELDHGILSMAPVAQLDKAEVS